MIRHRSSRRWQRTMTAVQKRCASSRSRTSLTIRSTPDGSCSMEAARMVCRTSAVTTAASTPLPSTSPSDDHPVVRADLEHVVEVAADLVSGTSRQVHPGDVEPGNDRHPIRQQRVLERASEHLSMGLGPLGPLLRSEQLALVHAAFGGVEHRHMDQPLARRRDRSVALTSTGSCFPSRPIEIEGDLAYRSLHGEHRRVVGLVVDASATGQQLGECSPTDDIGSHRDPIQSRNVWLTDEDACRRRAVVSSPHAARS